MPHGHRQFSHYQARALALIPLNLHKPSLNRHIPENINASLPAGIRPVAAVFV